MSTLKTIPIQGEKEVDNISSSRYIGHVINNFSKDVEVPFVTEFLNSKGILFKADCLDLLANIKEESIDLIFVDPPFNLGKNYDVPDFSDNMETEAYRSWCRAWLLELVRVLKPGGSLFLYHWPKWLIDLGAWLNTLPALSYKSWIACKMKAGFPIKGRMHPAHYGILHYVKKGGGGIFNVVRAKSPTCRHCGKLIRDYGGYRKKFEKYEDADGVPWIQISDFWDDTRPARQDKSRQVQINELPFHIPERVILLASKPGDIVLDCFAGGGSTLHAANTHGRLWIGCDKGKPIAALSRIATFIGRKEAANPNTKIAACFKEPFIKAMFPENIDDPKRHIKLIPEIENVSKSMEEYASKSKVMGF